MNNPPRVLRLDFETCATADLKTTGVATYAVHPDTEVICMAWAFDQDTPQIWRAGIDGFPAELRNHVAVGGTVAAWNVTFEFYIWNHTLPRMLGATGPGWPKMKPTQLEDTMARAAYWGLPMKLDDAAPALNLSVVKDKEGAALMKRMMRPRGTDENGKPRWWHKEDPAKRQRLCDYCIQDVATEQAVSKATLPLPPREARVWLADFDTNARGVKVDLDLVDALDRIADAAVSDINTHMDVLTAGAVKTATNSKALTTWLRAQGYNVPDVTRPTLEAARSTLPSGPVLDAVGLRLDAARTSAAKLSTMRSAAHPKTGRIHGLLQHYGAGRTGRWAGRLVQPQNFPRGSIKKVDKAIAMILGGCSVADLNLMFEDSAMGVVASCLRGCFVAEKGKLLWSADLSQIEARMVAWLAGQDDILDVFRSGQDVYVYTAAKQGSSDRQYGKVQVLSCGFGVGPGKFREMAEGYRLFLSEEECVKAVADWREANPAIVGYWQACNDAAWDIAAGSKKSVTVGPAGREVEFSRYRDTMFIKLPSGRQLVYRDIGLRTDPRSTRARTSICYKGVDQTTRKWGDQSTYGGKLVENITQAAARCVVDESFVTLDSMGAAPILTVHDELIGEERADKGQATLETVLQIMRTTPTWAPGLPVEAAGWVGPRYKKG